LLMRGDRKIGIVATGSDCLEVLRRIKEAESLGIYAAWLTTAAIRQRDNLTALAAAASLTKHILLGTSVTPIWERHPIVMAQQARVVSELAPGRFRLGVGLSHKETIKKSSNGNYEAPLVHLREYLRISKAILQHGAVDYNGMYYHAHAENGVKLDVPVMSAALQRRAFELCGAEADGAITWVCPRKYNKEVALPLLRSGAEKANRSPPPLIAHAPVCVCEDPSHVRAAVREQMAVYPKYDNYARMFADAGFPEAIKTRTWSDRMIDAVVLYGNESMVTREIKETFDYGASEVIVSPILVGADKTLSYQRTLRLLVDIS
jgi:alkanesulfonate monooxygenase SsuD/methylene tetrahydromethanopterin reductase-like flavin-dependent oxidoreductase (luciferase family)